MVNVDLWLELTLISRARLGKQSQSKGKASTAALSDSEQPAADLNPPISDPPDLNMLVSPMAITSKKKGAKECVFSSKLSLFGNYALLDNFNMDGFTEDTPTTNNTTDLPVTTAPLPLALSPDEYPFITATSNRPLSRHPTLPLSHNSKAGMQTVSSDEIWHPSTSTTARSCGIQDTPTADSNGRSSGTGLPSLESPFVGDTVTQSEDSGGPGWQTPLHIAASRGHDRIIRILLQHQPDCNERDSDGLTPLFHACMGAYEHIATLLLDHGARLDDKDNQGRTVLHLTVLRRQEALLMALLQHSASNSVFINSYDGEGRTALHIAVDMGFETGVRALLEQGANLNCKTRKT
ncbi:hypothetical protein GQX73_g1747 [Xylaria multiplex]|uniref:Uncharacterized protein n=1 Tax=Xylaria multiplex TaxID=323545 RepID=A0A7C8IXY8_9PEZI|nr:hypothetical protein GQX73_g1747 [Xylaria multiplex]